ncbi:hypothetical protein ACFQI7_00840 [Paenibacillus allorhizosphaerae]|uniref:DUF998 domain-containing protein n=1 Tax=Paenibacillus allorhizosphaerae TaxID=2849866 RepID=A0ABM8V9Z5_9BACL|nr:hypothetical protein [Paenibacillus allorhizosphaerae]CAG7614940.1 hypothetical protein PAECIP111802_00123 [Paenibacillus allorhizosphaerae]
MNEKQVIRWLGMICLLAGIARMGMTPSSLIWGTDSAPELTFGFIASILMTIGTLSTYMVQSRQTGVIGFITVLAIILGNIATTCMLWSSFEPIKPAVNPDSLPFLIMRTFTLIGFTGGTLVFAILTYRANVFPRWITVLLVVMLVSMVLPVEDNKYFAFFWGLAYVSMGYVIWKGNYTQYATSHKSRLP